MLTAYTVPDTLELGHESLGLMRGYVMSNNYFMSRKSVPAAGTTKKVTFLAKYTVKDGLAIGTITLDKMGVLKKFRCKIRDGAFVTVAPLGNGYAPLTFNHNAK
jgi:hypothetical protein